MKYSRFLIAILILVVVFIIFNHYHAKQTQSNISTILKIDYHHHSPNETTHQWRTRQTESQKTKLKLAATTVVAGVLCFLAASICSACGIGGGGLFIPILTLVAGVDLKTASSLSAFMVTGGSLANVMCNLFTKSTKFGGKSLIDFDIALLSEPCMLLGVSVGVICNRVFPEWVITILFAVFLAWSTFKTCKSGVVHWRLESEEAEERGLENLKNGLEKEAGSTCDDGNEEVNGTKEPTLGVETEHCKSGFSWITFGVFLLVWFSFFLLHLLRDNRYLLNIILVKPCGVAYWILTSTQIPLAVIFTAWILYRKGNVHHKTPNHQDKENLTKGGQINKIIFPIMALSAGILGGIFGIGGGMLINPLLLEVGIAPEITAATCCLMVFFSSSMSAIQYYLLGMKHLDTAIIFATICFVQSILGLMVVKRAVRKYGRASLIVFSLGIVMALSTVLMTSFGALKVWKDYTARKYMGFKPPC